MNFKKLNDTQQLIMAFSIIIPLFIVLVMTLNYIFVQEYQDKINSVKRGQYYQVCLNPTKNPYVVNKYDTLYVVDTKEGYMKYYSKKSFNFLLSLPNKPHISCIHHTTSIDTFLETDPILLGIINESQN